MKTWHPIATAPLDGSLIIAKNPDDRGDHYPYRARWIDGQWVRLSWGGAVSPVRMEPQRGADAYGVTAACALAMPAS
jgi:hypothetical protein